MNAIPKIQPASEQERKLLPCPFCGTTEGLYPGYRWPGGGKPYQIDCCGCGIEFTPRKGMDVFAAWNRRTPPASEQGEPVSVSHPSDWKIDDFYFGLEPRKSTLPKENDCSDWDGSEWRL